MSVPPSIHILVFARYAELLGANRLALALPDPPTVGRALELIRELPGGSLLPARLLVALNARQAHPADRIGAGDELALLPPMAGG